MASGGFILVHRKMLDSVAMSDDWFCRLWITCLLKSNFKTGFFKGEEISPGSFAFSYRLFSESLGVSKGKLRRGLSKLEKSEQITIKAGRDFSIVTICNWSTYQDWSMGSRDADGHADGTPTDTPTDTQTGLDRKKGKKVKKGKKNNTLFDDPEIVEEIYQIYPKHAAPKPAKKAIGEALKKVDADYLLEAVKEFAVAKKGAVKQYILNPTKWFNDECWDDDRETWKSNQPQEGGSSATGQRRDAGFY